MLFQAITITNTNHEHYKKIGTIRFATFDNKGILYKVKLIDGGYTWVRKTDFKKRGFVVDENNNAIHLKGSGELW